MDREHLTRIFIDSLTNPEGAGSDLGWFTATKDAVYVSGDGSIDVAHLVSDVVWFLEEGTNPYRKED